jgi:hypothetical protein
MAFEASGNDRAQDFGAAKIDPCGVWIKPPVPRGHKPAGTDPFQALARRITADIADLRQEIADMRREVEALKERQRASAAVPESGTTGGLPEAAASALLDEDELVPLAEASADTLKRLDALSSELEETLNDFTEAEKTVLGLPVETHLPQTDTAKGRAPAESGLEPLNEAEPITVSQLLGVAGGAANQPEAPAALPRNGAEASMPETLRRDIASVLAYMDELLESLPEAKIAEFAQSEQFTLYKRVFKELGIA